MLSGTDLKARDNFLDNLKVLLIVIVVFGHILNSIFTFQNVEKSVVTETVWMLIYTFHMPLFVFISGYFSKRYAEYSPKTLTVLSALVVPYVVFNLAFYLMNRNFTLPVFPDSAMWYLYALIIWRLTLPLLVRIRGILPISFAVSLAMNLLPVTLEGGTDKALKYLPLFLLGYYLKPAQLRRLRSFGRIKATGIFAAGMAAVVGVFFIAGMPLSEDLIFAKSGFMGFEVFFGRCLSLATGLLIGAYLLILMPDRRFFFTDIGKATMIIYLIHYLPFVRKLYQLVIPVGNQLLAMGIAFAVSLLIVFVFSRKWIVWLYNKVMGWISALIIRQVRIEEKNG